MRRATISMIVAAVILLAADSLVAQKDNDGPGMASGQDHSTGEKRILNVLEQMLHGENSGLLSVPPEDGKVLRLLAEATDSKHVVEIGTSNGYATLWFCLALRTTGGKITTYEIDPFRAALARENFRRAGVDQLVTIIVGDAHEKVTELKEQIDIVFIDADKDGYLDYLNKLLPLVRPGGLILAHNTTDVADQMQDYLKAVTTNPKLETIFLHKEGSGLGVTLKKRPGDS
ncbi:MAG: O-methyltransferase [Sedimentisphaerales bacterium]